MAAAAATTSPGTLLSIGYLLFPWAIYLQTVGALRRLEIKNNNAGMEPHACHAHHWGIRPDPDGPLQSYVSLEATFRHRYYEYLTHLYNIHRLKRAQGLEPKVEIPFEGYWALSDWDRSEP